MLKNVINTLGNNMAVTSLMLSMRFGYHATLIEIRYGKTKLVK